MAHHNVVTQRILATGAHISFRHGAGQHFKPFLAGNRDGKVIDTDRSTVCLRSAISFLSSLITSGGRVFFLRTRNELNDTILGCMASSLGCSDDSLLGIRGFSTNTQGLKRNPSRKVKLSFSGSGHDKIIKPDCFVVLGNESSDRTLAIIQEAYRSQIPTVCLVDNTMPFQSFRKVTYPIPAVQAPRLIYLFCNLLTKSVLRDRQAIPNNPNPNALQR